MKYVVFTAFFLAICTTVTNAQWVTSAANIYNSNTGNVGIGTTTPATKFEVKSGIDMGATSTQYVGPLNIGINNDVGAGGALQYLLLSPAYMTGVTGLASAGLNGTLTFYRGLTGAFNFNADYHVNIQSAYQNTQANLIPLGENSPVLPLYTLTYNSVVYVAIKLTDLLVASTAINFFGFYWNNTNAVKPQLVLATSVTSVNPYKNYSSISSNNVFVNTLGNIGIGTNSPQTKLQVVGNLTVGQGVAQGTPTNGQLSISDGTNGVASISGNHKDNNNVGLNFNVLNSNTSQNAMSILSSGQILIGKTSQINNTYVLDVNGNARVNKLVVNTTGADFVFNPNYKLMPLAQLEQFVKDKQHLPGIETAENMQKDGLDVGDNQTKLLQKIEELTLYIIEENKRINQKNKEYETLYIKVADQQLLIEKLQLEIERLRR